MQLCLYHIHRKKEKWNRVRWHERWRSGMPRVSDERYWNEHMYSQNEWFRQRSKLHEGINHRRGRKRRVGDMEGGLEKGMDGEWGNRQYHSERTTQAEDRQGEWMGENDDIQSLWWLRWQYWVQYPILDSCTMDAGEWGSLDEHSTSERRVRSHGRRRWMEILQSWREVDTKLHSISVSETINYEFTGIWKGECYGKRGS